MVTTSDWESGGPGTRCGLPGGHGGTVTYVYVYVYCYVAVQSYVLRTVSSKAQHTHTGTDYKLTAASVQRRL